MSVRDELLKGAQIFADAAKHYESEGIDGVEFCVIIRDWLQEEAGRHIHLNYLDSGYEEISLWDHVSMTPKIVAVQPSVRMARLMIDSVDDVEEDNEPHLPPLLG